MQLQLPSDILSAGPPRLLVVIILARARSASDLVIGIRSTGLTTVNKTPPPSENYMDFDSPAPKECILYLKKFAGDTLSNNDIF